jgi:prepilin-type N-terminal cleavage/methylation domain-containing protein
MEKMCNTIINNRNRGFTLLELLVVVAMIGTLSTVVLASMGSAREKGKIATAQSQMAEFEKAIDIQYLDTGFYPGGYTGLYCDTGGSPARISLEDSSSGLLVTQGLSASWNGPYIPAIPKDPWGNDYFFSYSYLCYQYMSGCEQIRNQRWVSAIVSCGPTGLSVAGVCTRREDTVNRVLCE